MDVVTETFQESFSDGSINIPYNPSSSSFSSAVNLSGRSVAMEVFRFPSDATSVSVSNLPIGLDYNSSRRFVHSEAPATPQSQSLHSIRYMEIFPLIIPSR